MPRLLEDIFQNRYFVLLLELLLVYVFWKLFTRFTRKALEKSKRDNVLIGFVVSAETVFTVFLAIMMVISVVLDTRIVRILGAAGAGVAVLAIILKDAAANVMGGISVLASKKVNLGDRISVANAEEGYVTKIDLMFTTIKGTDSKLVLIPNAKIMSEGFVNYNVPPSMVPRPRIPTLKVFMRFTPLETVDYLPPWQSRISHSCRARTDLPFQRCRAFCPAWRRQSVLPHMWECEDFCPLLLRYRQDEP